MKKAEGSSNEGYAYGILSAALGAAYFCIGTYLVKPMTGVPVREFTGTLYIWATLFGFLAVLPVEQRKKLALTGKQLQAVLILGVLFGMSVLLAFTAVRNLDPTSAATLGRTSVLFSLILGFAVLGERLTAFEGMGAALILAGLAGTFALKNGWSDPATLQALGAALATSLYQLVAKRTMNSVPPLVVNAYRNVVVLVMFQALALVNLVAGPHQATLTRAQHGTIVLAAFVGPFLHSQLNLMALARLDMVKASLVAQTHPLFVMLFTGLFMATWPAGMTLAIDAVLLAGIATLIVASAAKKRAAGPSPAAPAAR